MRDGHIHTPFCPHGSNDSLEAYIEEEIRLGRTEMTFTEHFPLPKLPNEQLDQAFAARCSLSEANVPHYLLAVLKAQEKYASQIKINRGFEVDYLDGCEEQTKALLNIYGPMIEDSLLSTHFVRYQDKFYAVDNESEVERLIKVLPNMEDVYELYYQTLLKSVKTDLGEYKPKRIGHPGLVTIFQQKWPVTYKNTALLEEIAKEMKKGGYSIDFNVAGVRKPYCGTPYPSGALWELIQAYEIPYVYGSDSHEVAHICWIEKYRNFLEDMV